VAHPLRKPRYESPPSQALDRPNSRDNPSAISEIAQSSDQRSKLQYEDEEIVQIALPSPGWAATAAKGLIALGIIGFTAHFVGLIPTIVGVLAIVGALAWLVGSSLGDAAPPRKFRE